nr:hypothetical protein [uncultured Cupriavidus sp.]
MYFLGDGRGPLLEFLRNLGPQAVLLSVGLIVGAKLDLGTIDVGNSFNTAIFLSLILAFLLAAYANITLFIERCVRSTTQIEKFKQGLRKRKITGWRHTYFAMLFTWRRKRIFFLELALLGLILELGMSSLLFTAITSAASLHKLVH